MRSKKVIKCTFGDILFISLYSGEPVGSINWIGDYLTQIFGFKFNVIKWTIEITCQYQVGILVELFDRVRDEPQFFSTLCYSFGCSIVINNQYFTKCSSIDWILDDNG